MIIIDNRTGSKELLKYFPKNTAQLDNLDFGDFIFFGNGPTGIVSVAIERKVMSDLISSMTSGRLVGHQLPGLLSTYNYIWIIIEGIWRTSPTDGLVQMYTHTGWQDYKFDHRFHKTSHIIKYLLTLSIMGNVRIWFTTSPKETVQFITSLYSWWTDKEYDEHRALMQEHEPEISFVKPTLLKRVAKELDGIGRKKAGLINNKFGSVLEMCMASEDDWREIPGIGKKLACKIVESLQKGGK
ncbi:MAG: ERCC4 domain-containing protein [Candidatus Thorarchaeota archaeon]